MLDVDGATGLVRVEAGITLNALSEQLSAHGLAMPNLGDIDVQSIAGAMATGTHGTGATPARTSPPRCRRSQLVTADGERGRARRRRRTARRPGQRRRARRGQCRHVAGRPGLHARGRRRAGSARGDARAARRPLGAANDHFEFFTFPHSPLALTRTNNRTDAAAAAARRAWSPGRTTSCSRTTRCEAFCRVGRARPSVDPGDQPDDLAPCGIEPAHRPLRPHLRLAAARALHRDGVRDPARARLPRRCAPCAALDDRFDRPLPDRGPAGRARRRAALPRRRPRDRVRRRAHVPRHGVGAVLPRRRGDHGRLRRPPALGQAPLPDRGDARAALPGVGRASRPCATASIPDRVFTNGYVERVLGP